MIFLSFSSAGYNPAGSVVYAEDRFADAFQGQGAGHDDDD
jgi:hypothetical protein